MNKQEKFEPRDAAGRVQVLAKMGASIEKAARFLNAEFAACFYANKEKLWVGFMGDNGKPTCRCIGVFQ